MKIDEKRTNANHYTLNYLYMILSEQNKYKHVYIIEISFKCYQYCIYTTQEENDKNSHDR